MLRQSKISIDFIVPVTGVDVQDLSEIVSNRHWVMAEVMTYDLQSAKFYDHNDKLVAEWNCSDIKGLNIPQLDTEEPVILEQKSHDYLAAVKKERPAAWSAWTLNEEAEVRIQLERGLSLEEIADIHQRTQNAIFERMIKMGIKPDSYPRLGNRPEKRHYRKLGIWEGRRPDPSEEITICLGCGHEIISRPCECWKAKSTYDKVVWREHKYIYSLFGDKIGKRY